MPPGTPNASGPGEKMIPAPAWEGVAANPPWVARQEWAVNPRVVGLPEPGVREVKISAVKPVMAAQ